MVFPSAFSLVFQNKKYLTSFLVIFLVILAFLVYLPETSSNNRNISFGLVSLSDLILFTALSFLTSTSIIFNIFLTNRNRSLKSGFHLVGQGGASLISSLFASIFATASCVACATFLFGVIGVSGVFFLLDYRVPITLMAILILIASLYFTSQKVLGVCKVCKI
jgi:hypothetical protein